MSRPLLQPPVFHVGHLVGVLGLAWVLSSCGSTRSTVPLRDEDLTGFVLFIQETPDGQVSHQWRRAAEVELSRYNQLLSSRDEPGGIVLASNRSRDCDQEQIDCYRACMKRRLPSYLNHIKRGSGAHGTHCANKCLKEYMQCLELQKTRALEFPVIHDALDWLKRHRKEVFVGTVVVIAGVAFVVISAGVGLLVLAPVVLVASAGSHGALPLAGALA